MISWDEIEHHTEGFRKSEAYQEWKALLHPFYDPMPTVEYYEPCILLKKNNNIKKESVKLSFLFSNSFSFFNG